ncbi:MAG TPA: peptide-methionine (S)-S-oxide reductase [Gemmatimonadales bacterium]|jgi:hypothetical protein|nr:peptide-methionine (S)-S-oxide reductase [Gemmatimonadales bacterium]
MALAAIVLVPLVSLWLAGASSADTKPVFAGGCFWGVEAVFERLRGVRSVTAGYTDGPIEAVQVVDNPTQRDRQGPDAGHGPGPVLPARGMVRYRLGSVEVRMLPDTTYGFQLLIEPTGSPAGAGELDRSVVWLRFDPEAALAWLNSASGVLRTPVPGGPPEAIQWSPNLRPLDGRGGFLLGRHRKRGALQKDHWLAIADSAPGWQAKISAQEADSLLRLFLIVAGQSRIDSSARAAADKEQVDRPAMLQPESKPAREGSGTIAAQFVVGADGRVEPESILILLAASPRQEADAAQLVAGWRFEPARRGDHAVRQLVQQVISRR